jgi:hypothetical protein
MSSTTKTPAAVGGIPASLTSFALVSGQTAAAVGERSLSWWKGEVRAGRAPAPIVRRKRFTRWRLVDVQDFWSNFVAHADPSDAADVALQAARASARAKAKRASQVAQDLR